LKDRFIEAGLPHCSPHGLRKALMRRMAEMGYRGRDRFGVWPH
jgi:hypothetical protein